MRSVCWIKSRSDVVALLVVEPVAEMVQRRHEAVDRRHRRAQLVCRERDEVRLQLVRALERAARRARPDRGERDRARARSRRRATQQPRALPRRRTAHTERSRPRSSAAGRIDLDDRARPTMWASLVPEARRRRACFQEATTSPSALRIDRARADDLCGGLDDSARHLYWDSANVEQARHRRLEALCLRCAPQGAHDLGRREADEEGEDGGARALRPDRPPGIAVRRRQDEDECQRQRRAREREVLHAAPRDGRLLTAGTPEADRGCDRQHGPVHEEEDQERFEAGVAGLARLRDRAGSPSPTRSRTAVSPNRARSRAGARDGGTRS